MVGVGIVIDKVGVVSRLISILFEEKGVGIELCLIILFGIPILGCAPSGFVVEGDVGFAIYQTVIERAEKIGVEFVAMVGESRPPVAPFIECGKVVHENAIDFPVELLWKRSAIVVEIIFYDQIHATGEGRKYPAGALDLLVKVEPKAAGAIVIKGEASGGGEAGHYWKFIFEKLPFCIDLEFRLFR